MTQNRSKTGVAVPKTRNAKTGKYRSRQMLLLLYPENRTHVEVLERVKSTYDCLYITHDKDVTEDGEVKKTHIHVFLSFKNAKWNTAVAEELGLELRFIEDIRSREAALQYLVHYNEENKHHYAFDELEGSKALKRQLEASIKKNELSPEEIFSEIVDIVTSNNLSFSQALRACLSKGGVYVKEFRRSAYLFNAICFEQMPKRSAGGKGFKRMEVSDEF